LPTKDGKHLQFTLYNIESFNEYEGEKFNLSGFDNEMKDIEHLFLCGFIKNWERKELFIKKNKDAVDNKEERFKEIGKTLYKLCNELKKGSKKIQIILAHSTDKKALCIIFDMSNIDSKHYDLLKQYLPDTLFSDEKELMGRITESQLENLIDFTNKHIPQPIISLSLNELKSTYSKEQIEKALENSGIGTQEVLVDIIKSINLSSTGGGKIKKKINGGSGNKQIENFDKFEKFEKFINELEKLNNINSGPLIWSRRKNLITNIKSKLKKIKPNKAHNKLTLLESLLFVPQQYVDKNSKSRIAKYGKHAVMGTLGLIAAPVALPIALVYSPFYAYKQYYKKRNYIDNNKTQDKLILLESLLFVPQKYVDKNSESRIARYGKLAYNGIKIIPTIARLGTLAVIATPVALPIALVYSPYYVYNKYYKNRIYYIKNDKALNKLILLESLLFVSGPQYETLTEITIKLVNYDNIQREFNLNDNNIRIQTGINKNIYNTLIKSIKYNYDNTDKGTLSIHINNINNLIYFFRTELLYNKNTNFAKLIISLLEYIREHIDNIKTELIKDKKKEDKERHELLLNKLQEQRFTETKKLLEYKKLKETFGALNVNRILQETSIDGENYKKLIQAINSKNINVFDIKKLIDFFEKLKKHNNKKAEEIKKLLNNIIQTDYFRLHVETTKNLVHYYNIVAKFGREVVDQIHNNTGINEHAYKLLIDEIRTENIDIDEIKKLIEFFTEMRLLINEEAKRDATQIINSLNYLNRPNAKKIINLLDNILLTNDPRSLVTTTMNLLESNEIKEIFNLNDIAPNNYDNLIQYIGDENKNKEDIQALIEFFTKQKVLNKKEDAKKYANKIISLLSYVKTLHNSTLKSYVKKKRKKLKPPGRRISLKKLLI
tara:strand:+ start:147 stop:2819 length:2673 start_codon:yes stop_codon:yes gene_type:complete